MIDDLIADAPQLAGSIDSLIGLSHASVGWLVFNNPARHNAVSQAMWDAIPRLVDAFEADPEIRSVVLVGAGGKAFVAGADVSEFERQPGVDRARADFGDSSAIALARIADCSKPTLAAIRGACIGGGLAIALSCDMRIAAAGSRFAIPAAQIGIGYPFPAVQRLVALVGPDRAKAILFTARRYMADEAFHIGLVTETVPDAELEVRTGEITAMIGANAPLSIRAAKLAVDAAVLDTELRDLDAVYAAISAATDSDDFTEGTRAFMEKRAPRFAGR